MLYRSPQKSRSWLWRLVRHARIRRSYQMTDIRELSPYLRVDIGMCDMHERHRGG